MLLIIVTVAVILLCAALEEAWAKVNPPVSLKVSPMVMLRRSTIRAMVRVPLDPRNTGVFLRWTSDSGSEGSTFKKIDGDDGPGLFVIDIPDQPVANYAFEAILLAGDKTRGRDTATVHTPNTDGGQR